MNDSERYTELRKKEIKLAEAQNYTIIEEYDLKEKSINSIFKFVRDNRDALGLNKTYRKDEIELEFKYSNKDVKKSLMQTASTHVDMRDYLDVLSCLDQVIDSSVLIERHGDKSGNSDSRLKQVHVLLGAFKKGSIITPVELEIKENIGMDNQLYLAVAIKKSEVIETATTEVASASTSDICTISIQDLVDKINPDAKDIMKYIPTGFLSEEQLVGKLLGMIEDIRKYPNSPFKEELTEQGILKEILLKQRGEVRSMVLNYTREKHEYFMRLEGREDAREQINKLNSILIEQERYEDMKRATEDNEYQDKLLEEFGLSFE